MILTIDPGNASGVCVMDRKGALHMAQLVELPPEGIERTLLMQQTVKRAQVKGALVGIVERQFIGPGAHSSIHIASTGAQWISVCHLCGLDVPVRPLAMQWRARLSIKRRGDEKTVKEATAREVGKFYPHLTDENVIDAVGMALAYRGLLYGGE
jgi:hypothetical protein